MNLRIVLASAAAAGEKDWPLSVTMLTDRTSGGWPIGTACRLQRQGQGDLWQDADAEACGRECDQGVDRLERDLHLQVARGRCSLEFCAEPSSWEPPQTRTVVSEITSIAQTLRSELTTRLFACRGGILS
jgi:hypothetical protein